MLLAVVIAAATCAVTHAQYASLPPAADLSISAEAYADEISNVPAWRVTVTNNTVGDHPGVSVHLVKARIVRSDPTGATSTTMWTGRNLPPGVVTEALDSVPFAPPSSSGPELVPMRIYAEIIETVPPEPQGYKSNNAAEAWMMSERRGGTVDYTNGDTALGVSVSDRFPGAGGVTSFTAHVANFNGPNYPGSLDQDNNHTQLDVQVKISLSPGLTFAGTQPQEPSGTTFATSTGIWNVGTLSRDVLSLPVAVTLSNDSLADLHLGERCLTAEVVSAVPWPSKRENDTATVCLGKDPKVLLTSGEIVLFYPYDCVGPTTYPCSATSTVEIVAQAERRYIALPGLDRVDEFAKINRGFTWLQPETIVVHVHDNPSRVYDASTHSPTGSSVVSWQTGRDFYTLGHLVPGVKMSYSRQGFNAQIVDWASIVRTVTVSGLDGREAPGRVKIRFNSRTGSTFFDPNPTHERTPFSLTRTTTGVSKFFLEFSTLGTYLVEFKVDVIRSDIDMTTYTDAGVYTFHVGPMADLEVRDGGASPVVAAGQMAYTIVAVNNGPDVAPSVRVTGLPTGATVLFDSEAGYNPATGVWTIGELDTGPIRHAGGMTPSPTLTLAATSTTPITAIIENTQDYEVCIDSSGDDVSLDSPSETACTNASPTNTWHTTKYFDHIEGNSTTTIEARAGTGEGAPGTPSTPTAEIHPPSLALLSWTPVQDLYGHPVTGYEVERLAGPGQETVREVKGTIYADAQGGGGNLAYRVRAVNEFGVKGPWSQVVETQAQTGRAGKPTGLTVTASGTSTVSLSWTVPSDTGGLNVTIDGYRIDYSGEDNVVHELQSSHATTTYTHTGRRAGARHCYRVAAVNVNGDGDLSDWVCATTKDVPARPPT